MIPAQLRAGDSLLIVTDLTKKYPEYSAANGYALTLTLVGTAARYEIAGVGDPWTFQAGATDTTGWVDGAYTYILTFTKDTERHTVDSGTVRVLPDVNALSTFDGRSQAKRTLDAIEAIIEQRASKDQQQYTIAGRSLVKMPVADLFKIRDTYRMEVMREERMEALKKGLALGGNAIWARL